MIFELASRERQKLQNRNVQLVFPRAQFTLCPLLVAIAESAIILRTRRKYNNANSIQRRRAGRTSQSGSGTDPARARAPRPAGEYEINSVYAREQDESEEHRRSSFGRRERVRAMMQSRSGPAQSDVPLLPDTPGAQQLDTSLHAVPSVYVLLLVAARCFPYFSLSLSLLSVFRPHPRRRSKP